MSMNTEEFNYPLPPSLIAQYPPADRGKSRLLVLRRGGGETEHSVFEELPRHLRPGDLLVTNNTRVFPARLIGCKESGGKCELLLIPPRDGDGRVWDALIRDSKKIKPGMRIHFGEGLDGIIEAVGRGKGKIRFCGETRVPDLLEQIGRIPLPPYIRREDEPLDRDRYQTIFAKIDGSIASPTAGLHFTEDLMGVIRSRGARVTSITLHVGIGTFSPVRTGRIEDHTMASEWIELKEDTAREIAETKKNGGRVIAVGTTTTRALESFADPGGGIKSGCAFTSLFICPPYAFRVIDGLITNFHLPKSTLLMLASAFAGKDTLMKAYREAVERRYRFYSYGDAMLII
jgi:S-adenosylmethionine:tRNA ribosyltransferase-isomerase